MLARHSCRPSQPTGHRSQVCDSALRSIAGLTLILASLFASRTLAMNNDSPPVRTGLHNSDGQYRLNAEQLNAVLSARRGKTGFVELSFDGSGRLSSVT